MMQKTFPISHFSLFQLQSHFQMSMKGETTVVYIAVYMKARLLKPNTILVVTIFHQKILS